MFCFFQKSQKIRGAGGERVKEAVVFELVMGKKQLGSLQLKYQQGKD